MDTKLCRICLNKNGSISVFDTEDDLQYSAKIMRCVNVVIAEDDELPKMLCDSCAVELATAYDFVQRCEASDKALRCLSLDHLGADLYADLDDIKIDFVDDDVLHNLPHDAHEFTDDTKEIKLEEPDDNKTQTNHKKRMKRGKVGPIQCVICGLMANSQSAMDTHMRTHTGEKPFPCTACEGRFPTKGALKRHFLIYHSQRERKFICETCGNSFFSKSDIITHMRIHTNEKPYVCPYCTKQFRQIASLIRHKRVHTGEKPYACPICDKKFADRSLVNKHQLVHSSEKKFTCHLCSKSVKTKSALNTHLRLHSNEKQNVCTVCGMSFFMKGNLQTHMRRMHSDKSGQCSVCYKTFSHLEEHMRKHTGERPFVCELCSQAFVSKRSLAHHMVFKHKNATKFKCSLEDCSKTFPTEMMLEYHLLKEHTHHTPYVCLHCARSFFRKSDLSRHVKVSHIDVQKVMLVPQSTSM